MLGVIKTFFQGLWKKVFVVIVVRFYACCWGRGVHMERKEYE